MGRPKSKTSKVKWHASKANPKVGSIVIDYVGNRYSTGVTGIKKSHVTKSGLLNNSYGDLLEVNRLNTLISNKQQEIQDIINEAISLGINEIQQYISLILKNKRVAGANKFIVASYPVSYFAKEYVEHKKSTLEFKAPRSKERYDQFLQGIEEYERKKKKISLVSINRKWLNDLIIYLGTPREEIVTVHRKLKGQEQAQVYEQKKKRCKKNTTLNRFIKDFWYFLRWTGKKYKIEFDDSLFEKGILLKVSGPKDNVFALTYDHLDALIGYVPEKKEQQKAKDLFLFCAFTGLSYSDAISLFSEHISEDGITINRSRVKTDVDYQTVMVPLAQSIFDKYYKDFRKKFPTTQRININLRKVLKEIPVFHQMVDYYEWTVFNNHLSKEEVREKRPLWRVLKFHSSRKTFITQISNMPSINMAALCKLVGWTINSNSAKHYVDFKNVSTVNVVEDFKKEVSNKLNYQA